MKDASGLGLDRRDLAALRHVVAFYERQGRNPQMRDDANRALSKLETRRAVTPALVASEAARK